MTSQQTSPAPSGGDVPERAEHVYVALRSLGVPNSVVQQFDFWDDRYEGRRLFSELLGTFFLVLVAVGGGMVSARFGGNAVPYTAKVVAPALMVAAIILFMGAVSGAHLNPAVSVAFALRGDFPWKRVPAYIVAQILGAILATLVLWALIGKQGSADADGTPASAQRSHRRLGSAQAAAGAPRHEGDPDRDGPADQRPDQVCPPRGPVVQDEGGAQRPGGVHRRAADRRAP